MMKNLTLIEAKQKFDLLVQIKQFCDKKHLIYYLMGKILWRAIQYNGFIPWDDDIDMSEFLQKTQVFFEGAVFPAFACWGAYLRRLYGDYMQLPTEKQRRTIF